MADSPGGGYGGFKSRGLTPNERRRVQAIAGAGMGGPVATGAQVPNPVDLDPHLRFALDRIQGDYGVTASVAAKRKTLLKFGRNQNVGSDATGYTIWYTGQDQAHETYVAAGTNSIDTISSSDGGDTQAVVIEGHTSDADGNLTFVVQSATLEGQGKVVLSTPLNRMTRLYNNGATDFAGEVYGYEDTAIVGGKPTDTTKIHITVPVNHNQSEKASTSISQRDYWVVEEIHVYVNEKAAAFADISLQVREKGKVFRTIFTASTSNAYDFSVRPTLIVPANSDVRLVAVSDSTSRDVGGVINGYLAIDRAQL